MSLTEWEFETPRKVTKNVTSTIPNGTPDKDKLVGYHPDPTKAEVATKIVKGAGNVDVVKFVFNQNDGWPDPASDLLGKIEFVLAPDGRDSIVSRPKAGGSLGSIGAWTLHYCRIEQTLNDPNNGYSTILQWYQKDLLDYVFTCWKW